jgi:hypothetical protein
MRTQLQGMSEQLDKLPPAQNEVRMARSHLQGLLADLDHVLYGQTGPQNQPLTPQQQQRAPGRQGLPVPIRVRAPQRSLTYDVVIGPLPNQRFLLTIPPGETLQSLYSAAVQRGQVVEREHLAGALTLDGRPARPSEISGQIPPTEATATTPQAMLSLLLLHNCFSLNPVRSPGGADYTAGGGGHSPGFDVTHPVGPNPMSAGQNPPRGQRLDEFRDEYLAQQSAGSSVRVALLPQPAAPATRSRRRRGG